MQSIPVQPRAHSNEVVQWFKKRIHTQFWEIDSSVRGSIITCSWVLQPIEALLSKKMGNGETLQLYVNRYWELYYEIVGGNE